MSADKPTNAPAGPVMHTFPISAAVLDSRHADRMKRQSEAFLRTVGAELLLRQGLSLLDRLGEGEFIEAMAIKSVLEVFEKRPADLVAVAGCISDQLKFFRAPCDYRESAILLAAWALVEDAYKLEREAADDLGDLAAVWAKWTREREFSNGDFIQFGGVLQP